MQERRASVIETLGRNFEVEAFFKPYGMNLNCATGPQYLPYVYDANQYTHQYRVELFFTKWQDVTLERPTAASVDVGKNQIVNIDTLKGGKRMSIPASQIVFVTPRVITAGSTDVVAFGLLKGAIIAFGAVQKVAVSMFIDVIKSTAVAMSPLASRHIPPLHHTSGLFWQ